MSAYIVEDETINKVVSYLYVNANAPLSSIQWEATKLFKMGYDLSDRFHAGRLADAMFNLNVKAIRARYGEKGSEGFPLPVFIYVFTPATQIKVITALKTWKYQCTEGDIPRSELYKAMAEVHCLLCIDFVEQTEEYEAAPWG